MRNVHRSLEHSNSWWHCLGTFRRCQLARGNTSLEESFESKKSLAQPNFEHPASRCELWVSCPRCLDYSPLFLPSRNPQPKSTLSSPSCLDPVWSWNRSDEHTLSRPYPLSLISSLSQTTLSSLPPHLILCDPMSSLRLLIGVWTTSYWRECEQFTSGYTTKENVSSSPSNP